MQRKMWTFGLNRLSNISKFDIRPGRRKRSCSPSVKARDQVAMPNPALCQRRLHPPARCSPHVTVQER